MKWPDGMFVNNLTTVISRHKVSKDHLQEVWVRLSNGVIISAEESASISLPYDFVVHNTKFQLEFFFTLICGRTNLPTPNFDMLKQMAETKQLFLQAIEA